MTDAKAIPESASRLDQMLVTRGLVETRSKARDLVLRGAVTVSGQVVSKPAARVSNASQIAIDADAGRWVSRAALKLIAGLDAFSFDCRETRALDVGASTGGFTQVLLKRGAQHVVAIDVGRGQLHPSLSNDARVTSLEQTDARGIAALGLAPDRSAIVCDVSFISLEKVLPAVLPVAEKGAWLIALIKPQFEVGREYVGKGGIVKNDSARHNAIQRVSRLIAGQDNWSVVGTIDSPITGGDGNRETLIGARHG